MDGRVESLTPWQRVVYDLCWTIGAGNRKEQRVIDASAELNRMEKERPEEFKVAFDIWTDVMYDVMY